MRLFIVHEEMHLALALIIVGVSPLICFVQSHSERCSFRGYLYEMLSREYSAEAMSSQIEAHSGIEEPGEKMALVVYDEKLVSPLHKNERSFDFGEHRVVIRQNWQAVGIAAVVWDAAIVLGEYLVKHKDLVAGKSVLELGAGTGLAGIVAAILGANTLLTDREMALDTLKENIEANKQNYPTMKTETKELTWGENLTAFDKAFDIILGADIVYIEETFPSLLATLQQLSDINTLILMSSKLRYERDTRFYNIMKQHFRVEEILYDKARDIHIYSAVQLADKK